MVRESDWKAQRSLESCTTILKPVTRTSIKMCRGIGASDIRHAERQRRDKRGEGKKPRKGGKAVRRCPEGPQEGKGNSARKIPPERGGAVIVVGRLHSPAFGERGNKRSGKPCFYLTKHLLIKDAWGGRMNWASCCGGEHTQRVHLRLSILAGGITRLMGEIGGEKGNVPFGPKGTVGEWGSNGRSWGGQPATRRIRSHSFRVGRRLRQYL